MSPPISLFPPKSTFFVKRSCDNRAFGSAQEAHPSSLFHPELSYSTLFDDASGLNE